MMLPIFSRLLQYMCDRKGNTQGRSATAKVRRYVGRFSRARNLPRSSGSRGENELTSETTSGEVRQTLGRTALSGSVSSFRSTMRGNDAHTHDAHAPTLFSATVTWRRNPTP